MSRRFSGALSLFFLCGVAACGGHATDGVDPDGGSGRPGPATAAGRAEGPAGRTDWRPRLDGSGLDRADLPAIVVAAIAELVPGAEAGVVEDYVEIRRGGNTSNLYLDNLWRELCLDGVDRVDVLTRYVIPLATVHTERKVDRAALLPIVRTRDYLQLAIDNGGEFPSEPIVGDLVAIIAEDSPTQTRVHQLGELEEQGFTREELFEIGMRNLAAKREQVEVRGDGPVHMLVIGNEIEASLLLLPELWDDLARPMRGPLVAAVPTRDVVFFTDSASADAVVTLRAAARELFGQAHPISPEILVWRMGRWELFSAPEQGR